MIGPFAFALVLAAGDPRPVLVQLQIENRRTEALARTEQELAEPPSPSRPPGLAYLRGALLESLGRRREAMDAFADSIGRATPLAFYSRYRLALAQERAGHPEVAAGLIATALGAKNAKNANPADLAPPILPEAVRLLARTLTQGGDCRLLQGIVLERMPIPERRQMLLAEADCARKAQDQELARTLLVHLLETDRSDDVALEAARRLVRLVPETEHGEVPRLLGLTFEQHREFELALAQLQRATPLRAETPNAGTSGNPAGAPGITLDFEAGYAAARAHFWQGRYGTAGLLFRDLAKRTANPEQKAAALYQEARSFELLGHWQTASASFRRAYLAHPGGEWAAPALFAMLRLDWRGGDERGTLAVYNQLCGRLPWRETAARAALFLAASDLVRQRGDRARPWLDRAAAAGNRDDQVDVAYWRGRLAELLNDSRGAVGAYLQVLRADLHHPLARAAVARLNSLSLLRVTAAEGRRLAASSRVDDLGAAWLLLGDDDVVGAVAKRKLRQALLADRITAPFLRLAEVPVERWPLWQAPLQRPDEMLLALGLWHEGAPAVREHFPLADPALAYTAATLLARAGETHRAMDLAEDLRLRTPDRLPLAFQPEAYGKLLYPLSYRETIATQGQRRQVDPLLLAAILREESRFDPAALSRASARGLAQFVLPTAQRLSDNKKLTSEDLFRPEVSISLGAAYLEELLHAFGNAPYLAVAAYNAGKPQVKLWKSYCYSQEPEEFFTKIGFIETRSYVRRVLTSWSQYTRIYP
ncbi:MAG TPA: lytic transglycosylase domain-containing protein [Thermoanaerobaculia bacterium]|nr:lytic transglycosylase domain-containing protein [Thermoanaerobaculia bacterium]